jgi:WD40 repeat protein
LVSNWHPELQLEWQGQLSDLVTAIVCAPNGASWVASSAAGAVVWSSGSTDPVELQAATGQSIDSIGFSADNRWLAAGGQAGELFIWNCDDSQQPPQLVSKIKINKWIEHLDWHPIESSLAISYGAQVKIWDVPKSAEIATKTFTGGVEIATNRQHQTNQQQASIFDLAWHPTGEYLAMAGYKGVQIWAYLDGSAPIQTIEVETASITLAWARNGNYLAVGNLDRTLTVLDWQHPIDRWTLTGCPGKIRQIVWLADSLTACFAVASGAMMLLWELTTDATSWNGQCLEGHQDTVVALAAHPDRSIIASASADGYTCLWSEQGEIYQIITEDLRKFTTLAWHPQSKYLVIGTQTGSLGLWTIPA